VSRRLWILLRNFFGLIHPDLSYPHYHKLRYRARDNQSEFFRAYVGIKQVTESCFANTFEVVVFFVVEDWERVFSWESACLKVFNPVVIFDRIFAENVAAEIIREFSVTVFLGKIDFDLLDL
jgi:hypothetical protein